MHIEPKGYKLKNAERGWSPSVVLELENEGIKQEVCLSKEDVNQINLLLAKAKAEIRKKEDEQEDWSMLWKND